jgi:hypothetical protein
MLALALSYMAFVTLRYSGFYHEEMVNFVIGFFHICWDDHVTFILDLLMCCIIFIDLCMLSHPYIPAMKPTWEWCMMFLTCYWILLRIFAYMFIKKLAYNFLVFCAYPFSYQVKTSSIEWVYKLSFPSILWNNLRSNDAHSSVRPNRIQQGTQPVPGILVERLFILL